MKLPYPACTIYAIQFVPIGEYSGMEETEEITTLSLCTGTPDEISGSSRGTRCRPKPPVRLHGFFPDHQLQAGTDHERYENRDSQASKKLRLTGEQLTVLENVYWDQSNLDLVSSYHDFADFF